eukprot:7424120-Lingulodinium_polyedra.AAC.1
MFVLTQRAFVHVASTTSQVLRPPRTTGNVPLKTQQANAHAAAHSAPRRRISALRARMHACDAIRDTASAGRFLSL